MSVIWELDSNYEVVDVWYGKTIIRSAYKLFYEVSISFKFMFSHIHATLLFRCIKPESDFHVSKTYGTTVILSNNNLMLCT